MGGVGRGDLIFIAGEGLLQQLELAADQLDPQHEALDQGRLVGDRHGLLDQGQPLFQEFGAAASR